MSSENPLRHMTAGKIILRAYLELGVALDRTILKRHRGEIKNVRKQLEKTLESREKPTRTPEK